jgi:hypothetical protein
MRALSAVILALLFPSISLADGCNATTREDFGSFFSKFREDQGFSVNRTHFPLKAFQWEYGLDENGKDDSAPRRYRISKFEYEKSPSLSASMKKEGLDFKIKSIKARTAIVEVFKPDTGWLMSYRFIRKGNCWFLDEFGDHST